MNFGYVHLYTKAIHDLTLFSTHNLGACLIFSEFHISYYHKKLAFVTFIVTISGRSHTVVSIGKTTTKKFYRIKQKKEGGIP
jgi:hypothetical protein